MVDTTVGIVLDKLSAQWHQKRPMHRMWLHWREKHLRTARLVAVHAVAAQTATTGEAMPMQVTDQLMADQAPAAAKVEELLTALHPAPMQTPAEQPAVVRQIAPQSGELLLPAWAAVHKAWKQHWSTISKYEEAGSHDQFNYADRPNRLRSWIGAHSCIIRYRGGTKGNLAQGNQTDSKPLK